MINVWGWPFGGELDQSYSFVVPVTDPIPVTAILVQKETCGNLAHILDKAIALILSE